MPGPEAPGGLEPLLVILAMAVLTFGTRIGGFWIMRFMRVTPALEAFLRYLSGSVLMAILAPAVLAGGAAALLATGLAVLVAARTHNVLLAMAAGVSGAALLRGFLA